MPELVAPYGRRWLDVRDDDMSKCDRAESSQREDEVREAPIAHIEEAAVPNAWDAARQETHQMADRVGVMLDEPAAKGQGMVATTRSTAARTR